MNSMGDLNLRKIILLIGILLINIVGCQATSSNNQLPTPTSSFNRRTENAEAIRPLLIVPDDLGIAEEYYEEETEGLLDHDFSPSDVMNAQIYLNLQTRNGIRAHGAYQDVLVYHDKEEATQVFEFEKDRFGRHLGEPKNVNLRIKNILAGCRPKPSKDYETCKLMVQHGRYLIIANMIVGESRDIVFTMDDWENFINVIQDRVIQQVTLEQEAQQE